MDLSFFRSNEEQVVIELIEVEAHTPCQTIEEGFLLVLYQLLVLVNHQLQLDHFLRLELILHQQPVCHSPV